MLQRPLGAPRAGQGKLALRDANRLPAASLDAGSELESSHVAAQPVKGKERARVRGPLPSPSGLARFCTLAPDPRESLTQGGA